MGHLWVYTLYVFHFMPQGLQNVIKKKQQQQQKGYVSYWNSEYMFSIVK